MVQRYLIVWLTLSSLAAYWWPRILAGCLPGGSSTIGDPFAGSKPLLPGLIALTMFAIGWMLPKDEVRQVLRRWPTVFGGTAVQYTVMPLLAWIACRWFGLEGDAMKGVILVGCVPGAMASNVLTLNARGNTSYSVSLTTTATILSPLVVPLALKLALGRGASFDPWTTSAKLALTVVLPVVTGHLLRRRLPRWAPAARRIAPLAANVAILWIIAAVVGLNRDRLAGGSSHGAVLAAVALPLLLVNLTGYLAGYGAGWAMRLPEPMRRALTIEIGMQNAGVGTMLAVSVLGWHEAAIPPALYTFGCMFTGTILAQAWAAYTAYTDRRKPSAGLP